MTAPMFDSVNVAAIPAGAEVVAGYVDGAWPTVDELRARFPHAVLVTITTTAPGVPGARVADVEHGDLDPAQAAAWCAAERAAGRRPTLYSSTALRDALTAALGAVGLVLGAAGDVDWWEAHYDGQAALSAGSVAKQYLGWPNIPPPGLAPGPYDVSTVDPAWATGTTAGALPLDLEVLAMPDPGLIVRWVYLTLLLREPDPAAYTADVAALNNGMTVEQLVANVADSPEGVAVLNARRHALGLAPI